MNLEEFETGSAEFEKTGFPGLCDRADVTSCEPSTLATRYVKLSDKEIYLYCDEHAPKDAVPLHPSEIAQLLAPIVRPSPTLSSWPINSITLGAGGSGYGTPPDVDIDAPTGANGVQATAHAVLTGDVVTSIVIDNPGYGYLVTPGVALSGGGGTGATGTAAPPSSGPLPISGFAKLRSLLNPQFGIHLRSTDSAEFLADAAMSRIIMQTLDASPANPYLVDFDQIILDPFTGPGQFDIVERDARRRVFDGASAGGTAVLTSATMNFQPLDADKLIRVGTNPGRYYKILSRQSATQVTLYEIIVLPSTGLTLTMDGAVESEVIIATKSGFTDGVTTGSHSRLSKAITADKVYKVVFVPGTAGDGIYSIKPRAVYPVPPDQTPLTS